MRPPLRGYSASDELPASAAAELSSRGGIVSTRTIEDGTVQLRCLGQFMLKVRPSLSFGHLMAFFEETVCRCAVSTRSGSGCKPGRYEAMNIAEPLQSGEQSGNVELSAQHCFSSCHP